MSAVSTKTRKPPRKVEFVARGLGIQRSTGEYIALLLHLESEDDRASILTYTAKELGISLKEIREAYTDRMCSKCGMSKLLHKQNGGRCF